MINHDQTPLVIFLIIENLALVGDDKTVRLIGNLTEEIFLQRQDLRFNNYSTFNLQPITNKTVHHYGLILQLNS